MATHYEYNELGKLYITGGYGCSCHPFNNWKECNKQHRRKFKPGDQVMSRCTNKRQQGLGIVLIDWDLFNEYFYHVKWGPRECDEHLEAAAELIPYRQRYFEPAVLITLIV